MTPGETVRACSCRVLLKAFSASPNRGRQFEVSTVSSERHLLDVGGIQGQAWRRLKKGNVRKTQCRQGCANDACMRVGEVRLR